MIKQFFVFLLAIYTTNAFASHGGHIGRHDDRSYGVLSDQNYHGVVKLTTADGRGRCTGGFVSKNLVLTNSHCAVHCNNGCKAEFWDGSKYQTANLQVVAYFQDQQGKRRLNGTDWAVLLSDKESPFRKPVVPRSTPGQILHGGFGALRIIEDDEIPFLKDLYVKTKKEFYSECKKKESFTGCINGQVDKKLKEMGKKPLFYDTDNFKIQTCNITGTSKKSEKMLQTDCDGASGDSGAPYLRSGNIVGLNNSGPLDIFDGSRGLYGLKTENFYDYVQQYIKKYENMSVTNNTNNTSGATQTNTSQNQNVGGSTNTNGNSVPGTSPVNIYENPEQIRQMLLQQFNCD
jgi:hypothetical protein